MTANIVMLYDSDWNPQVDLQAMDRAHRIGQTKPVHIFRLITASTIEEKIIEKQNLKLKLDTLIIQKGRSKGVNLTKDDWAGMITFGADTIFKPGDDITCDDIDKIIAKGEQAAKDMQSKIDGVVGEKLDLKNFELNS
jgi:SWI/SNF-related matrix-associated actin-dependent regulator of chromatin subfamily A member 5